MHKTPMLEMDESEQYEALAAVARQIRQAPTQLRRIIDELHTDDLRLFAALAEAQAHEQHADAAYWDVAAQQASDDPQLRYECRQDARDARADADRWVAVYELLIDALEARGANTSFPI